MNASNDWKRNLDEIFRLHENRIEQELLEMARTNESHTPSKDDDITFVTALFDYMQLRLIATCKKVEVDFLARQSVREHHPKCDSSVGEAIDVRGLKGLKDAFPDQVLKIVEDADRNENDAMTTASTPPNDDVENGCLGSNETLVGF